LLAQFGRSGLVVELISRVGESFAQNLDARLSAPDGVPVTSSALGVGSLMWRPLVLRAVAIATKLVGRRP
jgi:aerobic carbon-monoxide dehydrogenase small subunit